MRNAKLKIKNAKWKRGSLLFVFPFAFCIFNFAFFCVLCGSFASSSYQG
jgi:hypothetical protein